jgi:hypothetical protein
LAQLPLQRVAVLQRSRQAVHVMTSQSAHHHRVMRLQTRWGPGDAQAAHEAQTCPAAELLLLLLLLPRVQPLPVRAWVWVWQQRQPTAP